MITEASESIVLQNNTIMYNINYYIFMKALFIEIYLQMTVLIFFWQYHLLQ